MWLMWQSGDSIIQPSLAVQICTLTKEYLLLNTRLLTCFQINSLLSDMKGSRLCALITRPHTVNVGETKTVSTKQVTHVRYVQPERWLLHTHTHTHTPSHYSSSHRPKHGSSSRERLTETQRRHNNCSDSVLVMWFVTPSPSLPPLLCFTNVITEQASAGPCQARRRPSDRKKKKKKKKASQRAGSSECAWDLSVRERRRRLWWGVCQIC